MPFELSKSNLNAFFQKALLSTDSSLFSKPSLQQDAQDAQDTNSTLQEEIQKHVQEQKKWESKCLKLQNMLEEQGQVLESWMQQEKKGPCHSSYTLCFSFKS